jgi:hypothetical protein
LIFPARLEEEEEEEEESRASRNLEYMNTVERATRLDIL